MTLGLVGQAHAPPAGFFSDAALAFQGLKITMRAAFRAETPPGRFLPGSAHSDICCFAGILSDGSMRVLT